MFITHETSGSRSFPFALPSCHGGDAEWILVDLANILDVGHS